MSYIPQNAGLTPSVFRATDAQCCWFGWFKFFFFSWRKAIEENKKRIGPDGNNNKSRKKRERSPDEQKCLPVWSRCNVVAFLSCAIPNNRITRQSSLPAAALRSISSTPVSSLLIPFRSTHNERHTDTKRWRRTIRDWARRRSRDVGSRERKLGHG